MGLRSGDTTAIIRLISGTLSVLDQKEGIIIDNYTLYVHYFPDDYAYVGITKQKVTRRWGKEGNGYRKQKNIYDKITKYGWDNINHFILKTNLSINEAQQLETTLVKYFSEQEKCLNIAKPGGTGGNPWIEIEYDGEKYTSNELADKFAVDGVTGHDITTRLSRGWNINTAISQPKDERRYKVEYRGSLYTISELLQFCNIENMSVNTLSHRIFVYGWDIDRALSQPMDKKIQPFGTGERKYFYNGEYYNSYELSQMSNVDGLKPGHITTRIDHHGWSVERAITQPLKSRDIKYEYNGEMYTATELANLSPDKTMKNHDITDRIRFGWSIKDAVETPKGKNGKHAFRKRKPEK